MSAHKQRWYWFSTQPTPHGDTGPFGPLEACTVVEAYAIAEARACNAGLKLQEVRRAYRPEDLDLMTGLRGPIPKAGKR